MFISWCHFILSASSALSFESSFIHVLMKLLLKDRAPEAERIKVISWNKRHDDDDDDDDDKTNFTSKLNELLRHSDTHHVSPIEFICRIRNQTHQGVFLSVTKETLSHLTVLSYWALFYDGHRLAVLSLIMAHASVVFSLVHVLQIILFCSHNARNMLLD